MSSAYLSRFCLIPTLTYIVEFGGFDVRDVLFIYFGEVTVIIFLSNNFSPIVNNNNNLYIRGIFGYFSFTLALSHIGEFVVVNVILVHSMHKVDPQEALFPYFLVKYYASSF